MLAFTEFRRIRKTYLHETRVHCRIAYRQYVEHKKKEMNTLNIPTMSTVGCVTYTVDCSPSTTSSLDWYSNKPIPVCNPVYQQEGINPMNYATATVQAATTETQDQRKYLEKRLSEVFYAKRDPLEATFGLIDDDAPMGADDFKKRLDEGKYTFRTGDKYSYWHWTDLIQWRAPDRKQDYDGYKAAMKELQDLRQKSLDIIKIDDVKAGLDAVKALEAWEPTGAAN